MLSGDILCTESRPSLPLLIMSTEATLTWHLQADETFVDAEEAASGGSVYLC